ncbi:MAG: sensor histidine kinase [Ktedonobacteraceae bacterium]|nr:sensor histidine kinase [Ktedonobacteraceae bacterium]
MKPPDGETARTRHHERMPEETALARRLRTKKRSMSGYPGILVASWLSLSALSALALVLYVAGTSVYFSWVSTLCTTCLNERLTPAKVQALHLLGISITAYAAYWMAVNLVFALVYCAVAAFIAWCKPTDRVALFASFSLIVMGASFPYIPNALAAAFPIWRLPVALLDALGLPSLTAFLLLFPNGHFVPGWTRWMAVGFAVLYIPGTLFPGSILSFTHWPRLFTLPMPLAWLGALVFSQIYRYRRVSTPQERQQTKWVVFGATIALLGFLGFAFFPLAVLPLFFPLQHLALLPSVLLITGVYLILLLIPLTIAIAILRYRLWDIDLIINRTLVYGGLSAGIIGFYVFLVTALGTLLRAEGNLLISLFATGLVAVLFQPLREMLQRSVNRLLYGQRDEPYTVITRLSQRLKGTLEPEAVLSTIVETVAQALKLPYAAILWKQEETFELAASYGRPAGEPVTLPLVHQAETIGQLQLAPRAPGEAFTPADARLLDELARQAGLAAHAVRLAADLQKARERLVLAREEERRRLRRDLHDGVGPTLASLSQRIDTACHLVSRDPDAAIVQLRNLKAQIKSTIGDIRRVVYALRPPVLDELGLVSAIREHVLQLQEANGLQISIEAPADVPLLPAAVEVAAYRIILEALTNVERHAHAQHCLVRLELVDEQCLGISIADDGRGLPDDYRAGVGITSMRERVAELGGEFTISAKPGGGTHVQVRFPLKS